jgi:hypothetical protein
MKTIGLKVFSEEFYKQLEKSETLFIEKDVKLADFRKYTPDEMQDIYSELSQNKIDRLITIDIGEGLKGNFSVANFLKLDRVNHKIIQEENKENLNLKCLSFLLVLNFKSII